VDYVYFGEKACVSSIIYLSRLNLNIQNVAVVFSPYFPRCCRWEGTEADAVAGTGIEGGVDVLQALHGISKDAAHGQGWAWPGFRNLKEIVYVVESRLWEPINGNLDASVSFRPATSHGLTTSRFYLRYIEQQKLNRVHKGFGLAGRYNISLIQILQLLTSPRCW